MERRTSFAAPTRLPAAAALAVVACLSTVWIPVQAAAATPDEDLLAAAAAADLASVRRALERGADSDAENRYGRTALSLAAGGGHLEVVRLLLERGADPNRRDWFYDSSPVGWALQREDPSFEVVEALVRAGAEDRFQALLGALRSGRDELARAVIASGPLLQSERDQLETFRSRMTPVQLELLARVEVVPDPPPPVYTVADLERFAGEFEGWDNDRLVTVLVADGALRIAIGDDPARRFVVSGENAFRAEGGETRAEFFGRARTIEGVALAEPDERPVVLRRTVVSATATATAAATDRAATPASPAARRSTAATEHWPSFRGANAAGVGDGAEVPVSWNVETGENVRWIAPIPGLGNSSPVVWGDHVFVTTAVAASGEQKIRTGLTGAGDGVDESVEHSWRVLAFDRRTGAPRWDVEIARAIPETRRHFKATQANSSPATDGKVVVVVFPTAGMAALDFDGKVLWRVDLGGLEAGAFNDTGIQWGFAASPVIYGSTLILQVDVHETASEGPYLAAWDLASGKRLWRTQRRGIASSWATPAIVRGPEGDELVCNGSVIKGYDPRTGKELWSLAPNSELVVAAPVAGDGVVYVSAGYPPIKPVYAVRAGTRGTVDATPGRPHERLLWSHDRGGAYMPTPLLYDGRLYIVHHNNILVAYDALTGEALFKSRFSQGGTFTSSPIASNGRIYTGTEEGLVYVLEAGSEHKELAVNDLGEPLMATPAVSQGTLFLRTPSRLIAVGG
ncbi:MAG TPA: PQQ-binding-like beta-propeller repeat protein [Thermoanaerobaculia bacterium]|nr:PQQ-binding-like beta-propeller repeat protein [Thermoanaerobaculia bacterium]